MSGGTLYVSDLDGTLLNSEARLGGRTVEIINRLIKAGMLFTFATARSFSSAMAVTSQLELNLPVATYNGVFLTEPQSGRVATSHTFEKDQIGGLFDILRRFEVLPLCYALIEGRERVSWLEGRENPEIKGYLKTRKGDKRLRPVRDYDELFAGDNFLFTIINPGAKAAGALKKEFETNSALTCNIQRDTYNAEELWFEIFRADATKGHSVERLKALTGADEAVCFGDNLNDIPMFEDCDRGYAVANAADELKAAAAGIIGGNNQDGVAL